MAHFTTRQQAWNAWSNYQWAEARDSSWEGDKGAAHVVAYYAKKMEESK